MKIEVAKRSLKIQLRNLVLLTGTLSFSMASSAKPPLSALRTTIPSTIKLKKTPAKPLIDPSIATGKYSSWGINPLYSSANINIVEAWKVFKKKREIVVAVVDTGIDPSHPFLGGNIQFQGKSFGRDFSKSTKNKFQPKDSHGHGTHVSGIIKSVYPNVKILPLKYFNPTASGQDNLVSTIRALEYAVDAGVDIINYSGGGPEPSSEEERVLKKARQKGILVVAAAGNERSNIDMKKQNGYFPASYGLRNIITVTAHNQSLNILASSNWGKKTVDISAPGHRIRSVIPNNRTGFMTGTSQATAFVSGAAALIMANFPNLSIYEVKRILKLSAPKVKSLSGMCNSDNTGLGNCGRLDGHRALIFASKASSMKAKKARKVANSNKNSN
jgi:thermitase